MTSLLRSNVKFYHLSKPFQPFNPLFPLLRRLCRNCRFERPSALLRIGSAVERLERFLNMRIAGPEDLNAFCFLDVTREAILRFLAVEGEGGKISD